MLRQPADSQPYYHLPELVCTLQAGYLREVSGIAESRRNPGLFWVHNDSGDGPFLYGVDRTGRTRAVFRIPGAEAIDWEDMAIGPGPDGKGHCLYLGDIGDNRRERKYGTIYRVPEPSISSVVGSRTTPRPVPGNVVRRHFRYPDGPHNAEALLCHPQTGVLYIVTKEESGVSRVYRFPVERTPSSQPITLLPVGRISLPPENHPFPRLVTGGAIAPDGRRVALRTYDALYELRMPRGARSFEDILKAPLIRIETATLRQAEAVCYSRDGKSLLDTGEKQPTPIFRLRSADGNADRVPR
ncbi:MAG: hypothetical protein SFU56_19720 [Capsulimonadales bacterium]|nr:hypothetical protein [Capsulimonadales bacterium]